MAAALRVRDEEVPLAVSTRDICNRSYPHGDVLDGFIFTPHRLFGMHDELNCVAALDAEPDQRFLGVLDEGLHIVNAW